jgi:hypothetical protein
MPNHEDPGLLQEAEVSPEQALPPAKVALFVSECIKNSAIYPSATE